MSVLTPEQIAEFKEQASNGGWTNDIHTLDFIDTIAELQSLLAAQLQAAADSAEKTLRDEFRRETQFTKVFHSRLDIIVAHTRRYIVALAPADVVQAQNERVAQAYERCAQKASMDAVPGEMALCNLFEQWAAEAKAAQEDAK